MVSQVFALVLMLAASALAGADDDVRAFLRKLGERQAAIRTLRAHFDQEKHLTIVQGALRSSGTFLLDKAGRIAWQVEEPEKTRIVFSPDGMFVAGKPLPAAAGQSSVSPLPMIQGLTDLFAGLSEATLDRFDVTRPASDRLRLVPRSKDLARWVQAMEITIEEASGAPKVIRLEEPGGDVTEIRLSGIEMNPPLGAKDFAP